MQFNPRELAYCGLYCPQCSIRATYETGDPAHVDHMPSPHYDPAKGHPIAEYRCECCKGENECGPCAMQDCAPAKGLVSCANCDTFPCADITAFGEDGVPHHAGALRNLHEIREVGYEAWFASRIAPDLACACGGRSSWYYPCPNCHPAQPDGE